MHHCACMTSHVGHNALQCTVMEGAPLLTQHFTMLLCAWKPRRHQHCQNSRRSHQSNHRLDYSTLPRLRWPLRSYGTLVHVHTSCCHKVISAFHPTSRASIPAKLWNCIQWTLLAATSNGVYRTFAAYRRPCASLFAILFRSMLSRTITTAVQHALSAEVPWHTVRRETGTHSCSREWHTCTP